MKGQAGDLLEQESGGEPAAPRERITPLRLSPPPTCRGLERKAVGGWRSQRNCGAPKEGPFPFMTL